MDKKKLPYKNYRFGRFAGTSAYNEMPNMLLSFAIAFFQKKKERCKLHFAEVQIPTKKSLCCLSKTFFFLINSEKFNLEVVENETIGKVNLVIMHFDTW